MTKKVPAIPNTLMLSEPESVIIEIAAIRPNEIMTVILLHCIKTTQGHVKATRKFFVTTHTQPCRSKSLIPVKMFQRYGTFS